MDSLAVEYADQPVVFLEQDVNNPLGDRYDRWWAAYGDATHVASCLVAVYLPLDMVDSGYRVSSGPADWGAVYRSMVDDALARPPQAEIHATKRRVGDVISVDAQIVNRSGVRIGTMLNEARLHLIVYEEARVGATGRIVRAATSRDIEPDVATGGARRVSLSSPAIAGVDWAKVHAIVLLDYRPQASGRFDMLQAVEALFPPTVGQSFLPLILCR